MAGRAQELFENAVDLTGAEREAYLRGACGTDHSLRAEVDSLLRAHERVAGFLVSPTAAQAGHASEATTIGSPPREGPGERIGPYKLLQLIGEGGFGSVFMAEQERPVSRKVALKIIKLGMDTRAVIARFEAERQALALMDHPNIARVLDAGATDTGRPYFVMELCKGEPIVDYCDKNKLPIPARLELFEQVCTAVQHAHTKGIIHRDIKPSNIMVSTQDGRPHAKVIDFGIAKATASRLTEKTLFTEHKALIGTPEYMSPEQAEGSLDIDTRTDVYSLGVLLYELLTGTTPFSSNELRSAAYAEIQRIIREVEPPKPSTRLSHNSDTIASVAAQRHTEPRKLGTIVRGELDWIVMKALEKDRSRRYETANGLAMDIRRYLAGEAVIAAPPSTAYRFRKFVRRNKGAVTAGALIALALILGLAGTAWQARIAADRAEAATEAEHKAKVARDEEMARADELKKVSEFQARMLGQINTTRAGADLLADVHERFVAALDKAGVPDGERDDLAEAFRAELGRVNATDTAVAMIDRTILKPAVKAIDEQFKDQPVVDAALCQVLTDLYYKLGRYDDALVLQERALAIRRRVLGEDHPDTMSSINDIGYLLQAQGKLAESEVYRKEGLEKRLRVLGREHPHTLQSMSNMGTLFRFQGKLDEAETLYREVLAMRRRILGEEHPDTLHSIAGMGALRQAQGRAAEAEPYLREALEKRRRVLGEENVEMLKTYNSLCQVLQAQGKLAEAEPLCREALEKTRRALGEGHPTTLGAVANMGVVLRAQGKFAEAEPYSREAMEKSRSSRNVTNVGVLLMDQGRLAEAEPYLREGLENRRRESGDEHPNTLNSIRNLGSLLWAQGKYQEVIDLLAPAEATARKTLSGSRPMQLAAFLTALGRARAALPFNTERFTLAETNLLEGHRILVQARSQANQNARECVQALIGLYTAWHAAQPDKGYDAKAAEWKSKLAPAAMPR
jgi:eukaryotic-like serine/threonine-protein kinase